MQPSSGDSYSPSINGEGDLVAFVSAARLVPEDTNGVPDVYLRYVRRGRTWLVSRGAAGTAADADSFSPALSADGRYVAFASMATNLSATDRNDDSDIYIHDVTTGATTMVSATARGEAANSGSRRPALSADGRLVVYQSVASNLGSALGRPPPRKIRTSCRTSTSSTEARGASHGSAARRWPTGGHRASHQRSTEPERSPFSSTQPVEGEVTSVFNLFERACPR